MSAMPAEDRWVAPHSYAEALDAVSREVLPLNPERVPLAEAVGFILAEPVFAPADAPAEPYSLSQGWAVAGSGPWVITDGESRLAAHQAAPIGYLDRMPRGSRAVLGDAQAQISLNPEGLAEVSPNAAAPPGAPRNGLGMRAAGSYCRAEALLLQAGTTLTAHDLAVLAECGVHSVAVPGRPVVLAVGEVPGGHAGLEELLRNSGARLVDVIPAPDVGVSLNELLSEDPTGQALPADVVIAFGVAQLRAALKTFGARIWVDALALHGCAESVLATLPDGRHVLGLSGEPSAALAGLALLAYPMLTRLRGQNQSGPCELAAGATVTPYEGLPRWLPGRVVLGMASLGEPESLTQWLGSDFLALIPPHGVRMGESVPVLELPWNKKAVGGVRGMAENFREVHSGVHQQGGPWPGGSGRGVKHDAKEPDVGGQGGGLQRAGEQGTGKSSAGEQGAGKPAAGKPLAGKPPAVRKAAKDAAPVDWASQDWDSLRT